LAEATNDVITNDGKEAQGGANPANNVGLNKVNNIDMDTNVKVAMGYVKRFVGTSKINSFVNVRLSEEMPLKFSYDMGENG